jgi:hypothetical protein
LLSLPDAATIAAILTSLGVGGLLGSLARGWQERSEKFRDRTIESCRDWLRAHDAARRELASLHEHVFRSSSSPRQPDHESTSSPRQPDRESIDAAMKLSLAAWRELQTHTFLVSLLLAGGTDAPAAQAAQALAVCYDRWRDLLRDVVNGQVDSESARKAIHFYQQHARAMYNDFVRGVNEAIRPSPPWRRRPRADSAPFDVLDDLDLFTREIWTASSAG